MYNIVIEFKILDHSKVSNVKQFKIEKKKMLAIDLVDIINILNFIKDEQLKQIVSLPY